ncbi:hypothetical protein [Rhizobium binae]|nr:hypothetical protein [Rhizobium binae]MBX4994863.1 hypothetical protein [Rhizobium binae]QSY85385.1 hypothetical protein J2J99_25540 [Rhizobium binae]
MPDDIRWLIGAMITVSTFVRGLVFAAFNNIKMRMNAVDERLSGKIEAGDDVLHDRLNRIRDEYARRSDLDGHIHRLESSIKDLREEHRETSKETTRRLDAIIASLAKNNA